MVFKVRPDTVEPKQKSILGSCNGICEGLETKQACRCCALERIEDTPTPCRGGEGREGKQAGPLTPS